MLVEKSDEKPFSGLMRVREFYGDKYSSYKDLTSEQMVQFSKINDRLAEYETVIKHEFEKLYRYAHDRIKDENDSLHLFDIEINIYFFLREDSPVYKDDGDNIMTILHGYKNTLEWGWGFGDDNNHNTIIDRQHTHKEFDKHCAFFHALYDHTELYYRELLLIGRIDFSLQLQLDFDEMG